MLKNSFFKTIPFLLFIILFNSCDKEFSVVGEDIVGDNTFGITKEEFPVVAYNQKIGPVQSNDMAVNPLGIYNNPSFGKTKANFVTQVALETLSIDFHASAEVTSVVLTIPYFSTKTATNSEGVGTYELDSIYGPKLAKMKLSIYESGYYMMDLDLNPGEQFTEPQKYYTNQYDDFYKKIQPSEATPLLLNDDSDNAQNAEFFFDPKEHSVTTTATDGTKTTTRTAPGMQLNLNKAFFETKILKASDAILANNDVFEEYFRGLVFNIESIGANEGNMAMINFQKGTITVNYKETIDKVVTEKKMVIKLSGHTASFLEQSDIKEGYANATNPANVDDTNGDANLYLKGGEGSISILKIFGDDNFGDDGVSGAKNGVPDRLDILRTNKCLVNQAELTFYLDSKAMGSSSIAQRIYLYDFDNNLVLADYTNDLSVSSNSKNNRFVFGGIIYKPKADTYEGSYYKFRITEHIRNLVKNKDLKNVNLGLVVTEDISKSSFYSLLDQTKIPLKVPMASVMNPLGTIVFGNNIPSDNANYAKRLKFEIYYTKPN
jgi:hypothetical protein